VSETTTANGLALHFDNCVIAVEANDPAILTRLQRYFDGFATEIKSADRPRSNVIVIEEEPLPPDPRLRPWVEKGKEAFVDIQGSRLVRKVRTNVTVSIREDTCISSWTVRGPVSRNFSQLVNVIGNAYGLTLMDRGSAMIHASAVCDQDGHAIAVMGQSGMGKSSVAVRLMEQGFDYISNDRVLLEPSLVEGTVLAHGLPKLPRVNPGTLLDGEHTKIILTPEARDRYESLTREDLWGVEDKYDLEIGRVLGRRWLLSGKLTAGLVLNWRHGGEGLMFERLAPGQVLTELKLVAKTFGVFDPRLMSRTDAALTKTANRVPVYRVTGRADPHRLAIEVAQRGLDNLGA
jgi:HprK-related kinase B